MRLEVSLAGEKDRETIYSLRHAVYASEIHQHSENAAHQLKDSLDEYNHYIVVRAAGDIAGFVSITPPKRTYSIDKYVKREECPFEFNEHLYEIRLLTVLKPYRGRPVTPFLLYAAFRWVEEKGGETIVAIGRREVLGLYQRVGLRPCGREISSGQVSYSLMSAPVADIRRKIAVFAPLIGKFENSVSWNLGVPLRPQKSCYHGGAFFKAVGEEFDRLEAKERIINADVLDAWFPPSPRVVKALRSHLEWALRTSPPTHSEGLLRVISAARKVPEENLLAAGGSSALIYLALGRWLKKKSRVLVLDPCYGEYLHFFEQVLGCQVEKFPLRKEEDYRLDVPGFLVAAKKGFDLVVIVNPANPTGQHVPRKTMENWLREIPPQTRVWIDEAYVEYVGLGESLEQFAATSPNVVVCKSMSKCYALSGARAAYLCAAAPLIDELKVFLPPWSVGLPAQIAAVEALKDPGYYAGRYAETRLLKDALTAQISRRLPWKITPGVFNCFLCHLPPDGPDAETFVSGCRKEGLFIRNIHNMGTGLNNRVVRIAVKDALTNDRMVEILAAAWQGLAQH